jgi:hypothetical protein
MTQRGGLRIYLEEGKKRTFAMAVEWPGWGRAGRDAQSAVEALVGYRDRYAVVAQAAGEKPPDVGPGDAERVDVVDRLAGTATTDFGAPGVVLPADGQAWKPAEARRQTALLVAAWQRFDDVVAAAPAQLRKGPRGGGRDRDAIVEHVLGTEPAYARKAGLRRKAPADRAGLDDLRAELLEHLRAWRGEEPPGSGWPAPYVVRRIAWHALDHAWEIEDRTEP